MLSERFSLFETTTVNLKTTKLMEAYYSIVSKLNVWRLCLALSIILFIICPIFFFLGFIDVKLFSLIWIINAGLALLCWYCVTYYHKQANKLFQKLNGH
jgi:membrane protein YdbS with pleckstrin-like domain